jgi:hypothetical protein
MEELRLWAPAILSLISIVGLIWGWFASPAKQASQQLASLGERVDGIDERVIKIEGELPHLPHREDVHALALSISELRGDTKVLATKVNALGEAIGRIQDYIEKLEKP